MDPINYQRRCWIFSHYDFYLIFSDSRFFFTETGGNAIFMFIFGIFLVTVMFYGTPFLTAFSYILFSIEVMDYSYDYNSEKLYKIMRKKGYDTTPRKLTNLFPSGFEELKRILESKKKRKTVIE